VSGFTHQAGERPVLLPLLQVIDAEIGDFAAT